MLVVETIAKIRRPSLVQGKSITPICRELKISRKVVRKVLRSGDTEFRYERKHCGHLPILWQCLKKETSGEHFSVFAEKNAELSVVRRQEVIPHIAYRFMGQRL